MSKKLIATESVRINGTWRSVEVYIDSLALACNMAPKAAEKKTGVAMARFGAVRVKVLPIQ